MAATKLVGTILLACCCSILGSCSKHTSSPDFEFEGASQGREDGGIIRIQFDREESSDYDDNDDEVYLRFETRPGSAEAGVDFFPATGVLAWDEFDFKARAFDVILIDDADIEGTEDFYVWITFTSLGLDFPNPLRIKILDDDEVIPEQSGSTLTYVFEIGEGKDGLKEIRLKTRPAGLESIEKN
ncbi:MAG: Calx-beta domain-containing protein [Planctomycetota bacterium]|jgi:hypothetical protein